MMYAMTKTEKVAHNRNVLRIRQKRWRDKRKKVLKLLSVENLPLYTNHRLGKVVHSILGEKAKARKRRKIQFNKISKNPDLLAEKRHKDSQRKRVHRAYRGVYKRWKKRESDETRIFLGAKTLREEMESKLDRTTPEFKKYKSWRADFFLTNFYERIVSDFDLIQFDKNMNFTICRCIPDQLKHTVYIDFNMYPYP